MYNAAVELIDRNVETGKGNNKAILFQDKLISYKDLQTAINKTGNFFKGLKVDIEDRISIVLHDSPEFIMSFFGAIKIGAIPIPLNTMSNVGDYEYYLNNSRSKLLIIQKEIWENIKDIKPKLEYIEHVITVDEQKTSTSEFHQYIKKSSDHLTPAKTNADDSAYWLYSSGSTGNPKGIIHHHKSMQFSIENFAEKVLKITEKDRIFTAAKLFFAFGLGNGVYFPLGIGASTVLMPERPLPEKVFEVIEYFKPTIFCAVPSLYLSLVNYAKRSNRKFDLSSIRICISAGESLAPQIYKEWKELFNVQIVDGIGSTELNHIYISNRIDNVVLGSSGRVVPGYETRIINEKNEECGANEVGDLFVKGGSIASSFWNNIDLNKKHYWGEWFFTGDKFSKDENGLFWYYGRSDDMVKIGGEWFSPLEIESILMTHEMVVETAVNFFKNKDNLVQLKVLIVPTDKEKVIGLGIDFQEYVKNNITKNAKSWVFKTRSWEIELVSELPKTTTGKIQRFRFKNDNN